jgi:hypothetical protein
MSTNVDSFYYKTPLHTRMTRWAESGKATKMPLHPQDYYVLSAAGLVEKMSEEFKMDITCLGGEASLKKWIKESIEKSGSEED